jgi:hypothetical protein
MSIFTAHGTDAYLKTALTPDGLTADRAREVADLVSGLGDLSQAAAELHDLMREAEQTARALLGRVARGAIRSSAQGRRLEEAQLAAGLKQAQSDVRRLREALQDTHDAMAQWGRTHGQTSELDELRAKTQHDELRARACEAELSQVTSRTQVMAAEATASALRQREGRPNGQDALGPTTHLQMTHDEAPTGSHGEPPAAIRPELDNVVNRIGRMIRRGIKGEQALGTDFADPATSSQTAEIQGAWAKAMRSPAMPHFADPSDLVQWVIRQAHVDGSQDIRSYAAKLQFSTQLKTVIRDELARARQFRSDHGAALKDGAMDQAFDRQRVSRDPILGEDGMPRVRPLIPAGEIARVEDLDAHIADLQNMLASTGDDMQISQLELQNMTQRQQQVMNTLSNLSKTLHETSMAIIRKIGN